MLGFFIWTLDDQPPAMNPVNLAVEEGMAGQSGCQAYK
jgi:hypothetical protein